MAIPSITDLKMWVGTLFTKDDWDFNFSKIVSWLADGNGDLVINSLKATNGIDLDGAQISNLGAATTGSQAITLDQANTLLNRTSYYEPFSIASGKVDNNGNSAYLQKDSDTQVTALAGNINPDLVCVLSDGTIESVTSNTVLTIPTTDGTYHIVKEKNESITITSGSNNNIVIGKAFPSSQNIGDYFLNNSVLPFKGYKYTTTGWVETAFCYLGYVTVSSGVSTVTTFPYNDNSYNVNRNNQIVGTQTYVNGNSGYIVFSNNLCMQWGIVNTPSGYASTPITFLKSFKDTNYVITTGSILSSASVDGNDISYAYSKTQTSAVITRYGSHVVQVNWFATGYIA